MKEARGRARGRAFAPDYTPFFVFVPVEKVAKPAAGRDSSVRAGGEGAESAEDALGAVEGALLRAMDSHEDDSLVFFAAFSALCTRLGAVAVSDAQACQVGVRSSLPPPFTSAPPSCGLETRRCGLAEVDRNLRSRVQGVSTPRDRLSRVQREGQRGTRRKATAMLCRSAIPPRWSRSNFRFWNWKPAAAEVKSKESAKRRASLSPWRCYRRGSIGIKPKKRCELHPCTARMVV